MIKKIRKNKFLKYNRNLKASSTLIKKLLNKNLNNLTYKDKKF